MNAVVVHIILNESAGGEVEHHGLDVQRRFVEPADDIFNGDIFIAGGVEKLPKGIERIHLVYAGNFVHDGLIIIILRLEKCGLLTGVAYNGSELDTLLVGVPLDRFYRDIQFMV